MTEVSRMERKPHERPAGPDPTLRRGHGQRTHTMRHCPARPRHHRRGKGSRRQQVEHVKMTLSERHVQSRERRDQFFVVQPGRRHEPRRRVPQTLSKAVDARSEPLVEHRASKNQELALAVGQKFPRAPFGQRRNRRWARRVDALLMKVPVEEPAHLVRSRRAAPPNEVGARMGWKPRVKIWNKEIGHRRDAKHREEPLGLLETLRVGRGHVVERDKQPPRRVS